MDNVKGYWLQFAHGRVWHWIKEDPYQDGLHVALCGAATRNFAIVGDPPAKKFCSRCQRLTRAAIAEQGEQHG